MAEKHVLSTHHIVRLTLLFIIDSLCPLSPKYRLFRVDILRFANINIYIARVLSIATFTGLFSILFVLFFTMSYWQNNIGWTSLVTYYVLFALPSFNGWIIIFTTTSSIRYKYFQLILNLEKYVLFKVCHF